MDFSREHIHQKAVEVISKCTVSGCMIGTSESVTGGEIASSLTKVNGCSSVLFGSQVVYSPMAKAAFCNQPITKVLEAGTVSREIMDILLDCMGRRFFDQIIADDGYLRETSQIPSTFISVGTVGVAGKKVEDKETGFVITALRSWDVAKVRDALVQSAKAPNSTPLLDQDHDIIKAHSLDGTRREIILQATSLVLDTILDVVP